MTRLSRQIKRDQRGSVKKMLSDIAEYQREGGRLQKARNAELLPEATRAVRQFLALAKTDPTHMGAQTFGMNNSFVRTWRSKTGWHLGGIGGSTDTNQGTITPSMFGQRFILLTDGRLTDTSSIFPLSQAPDMQLILDGIDKIMNRYGYTRER